MKKTELGFDKVSIQTVAKVGSTNFRFCEYTQTNDVDHGHNVGDIGWILENSSNCLIIVGVRNPIDRNLSYFFQTYNDDFYNDVKTKKNEYKGEFCYVPEMSDTDVDINRVIDLYFKQPYHNTFNEWFEEFLEVTNIDSFDRENGLDFYPFKNNNTIMIYTLENLNRNSRYIFDVLGISHGMDTEEFRNNNDSIMYQDVKENITYEKSYLDNLLDTKIMRLFYTESDINDMFLKYEG